MRPGARASWETAMAVSLAQRCISWGGTEGARRADWHLPWVTHWPEGWRAVNFPATQKRTIVEVTFENYTDALHTAKWKNQGEKATHSYVPHGPTSMAFWERPKRGEGYRSVVSGAGGSGTDEQLEHRGLSGQ